jgi:hypothetical protein
VEADRTIVNTEIHSRLSARSETCGETSMTSVGQLVSFFVSTTYPM